MVVVEDARVENQVLISMGHQMVVEQNYPKTYKALYRAMVPNNPAPLGVRAAIGVLAAACRDTAVVAEGVGFY